MKTLSLSDPYYIEYLLLVCVNLNLIVKIPSIHSNHAQVTSECETFFALSEREILDKIIDVAVEIAANSIGEIIPSNDVINNQYILSLLKQPVSTDDIFKSIYASIGFSIEQLMDLHDDDILDEMYASMLSSTFFLGVLIDKYFFTPFGFYLKFINPVYLLPYDIKKEMIFSLDAMNEADDFSMAMFSPCSHYTLSKLGQSFFGVEDNALETNLFPVDIPIDVLVLSLTKGAPFDAKTAELFKSFLINDNTNRHPQKAIEIKIKLGENKLFWKKIEFLEENTLHDLYLEICYEFNFEINMNYSVFLDINENPFSEYCSPLKKKRTKNTTSTNLGQLALSQKHKFLIVLYGIASPFSTSNIALPQKNVKFELEVMKIKDKEPSQLYPRLKSESQMFQDFDMDWLF